MGVDEDLAIRCGAVRALLVAAALTALLAWPVLVAPSQRLFGCEIAGREHDPFTVIEQFRGTEVARPYLQPATDWVGRVLALGLGPVAAFNTLVLVSFPLAAAAAYLLGRRLGLVHSGALIAGLLYAFSPFHVAHAAYHPHIAQTQWLPLYFLALLVCLENGISLRRAAFLALASALVLLSNFYGGFIAAVLTPAVLAAAWPSARTDAARRRAFGGTVLALAGLVAGALAAVLLFVPQVLTHREAFAAPRSDLLLYSARGWSYLVPAVVHPMLGAAARSFWRHGGAWAGVIEQQIGLGWSVLALAAVPLIARARGGTSLAVRRVPALAGVVAFAFFCSLAPDPARGALGNLRVSTLLYPIAPMFRAYARFGTVVQLGVALLAGLGFVLLWRSGRAGWRALAVALLAAAVFEYAPGPPLPTRDILPTSAHRFLEAQPGALRVLDCTPFSAAELTVPGLMHHHLEFLSAPTDDCGEPAFARKAAWRGFTHVIVRADSPLVRGRARAALDAGLVPVAYFADATAFAVVSDGSPIVVADARGFEEREYERERSWRWMGERGSWTVVNDSAADVEAELTIEMAAHSAPLTVDLLLDGGMAAELHVPTELTVLHVPPMRLTPGPHLLAFRPREPAAEEAPAGGRRDVRRLTVAVGTWRWSALR